MRRVGSLARPLLLGGLLLLATMHLAVLVYHLSAELGFAYDLNYGEGYLLNDALRLLHGQPLYGDIQRFPMVRSPYPPLFALVWSWLLPLSGPSFLAGRALEVLALGGLVGLVAWNAWRARAGAWAALTAAALVVASPFVYDWAGYARVDLLALAFGVGAVLAAQWLRGWRGILTAALLCSLALWTKQTLVTVLLAISLALLLRRVRDGIAFAALVVLPTSCIIAGLNAATDGQFVQHVVLGNAANPFQPARATYYVVAFAALHLPALAAGLWWLRRALGRAPSPIAVYLPVALLAAFSAGNEGSSVNYLIEPLLALALAVPFAWRMLPAGQRLAGPLFAVVQLGLLVHVPNGFGTSYLPDGSLGRTPTAADAAVGAQLDSLIRAEPGPIISEAAGFAVRNGRAVWLQPIDLRAEQQLGRWQPQPLVTALSSGQFRLVITSYDLLPRAAEEAIQQHFSLVESLPSPDGLTFRVYRYRA